jgi:hypothetical protein
LPLFEWTIVRLVVSENDGRRHNSEMEPQRRTIDALYCTRRQGNKTPCLEKTTLRVRDYVQTVGLNAGTKKDRRRAAGELFVLTFPFIGLYRLKRLSGVANCTFTSGLKIRFGRRESPEDQSTLFLQNYPIFPVLQFSVPRAISMGSNSQDPRPTFPRFRTFLALL